MDTAGSHTTVEPSDLPSVTDAGEIRTEIAGVVLDLRVAVGDVVGVGDVVALVEAMKMEIPVIAEIGGTITSIDVALSDAVRRDAVIATVDLGGRPQ